MMMMMMMMMMLIMMKRTVSPVRTSFFSERVIVWNSETLFP